MIFVVDVASFDGWNASVTLAGVPFTHSPVKSVFSEHEVTVRAPAATAAISRLLCILFIIFSILVFPILTEVTYIQSRAASPRPPTITTTLSPQ